MCGGLLAVESANIVGYIGKNVVEGTKLVTASFAAIGEEGMPMSNLKPEGYEANQEMIDNGGTWGDFVITFLNEGGETIAIYGWEQTYESGAWNDDGAWVEYDNQTGDSYELIPPGTSIFFSAPATDSGEDCTLQNAGEIVTKQISALLPEGTCCLGNPRATDISLDDLVPTGYLTNQEMIDNGGTWGDFVITFLNEGGETIAIYGWEQTYESGAWNDDGAWVEYDNDGTVTTTLAPGDGIFVTGAPRYDSEDRYYLVFPAQTL